MATDDATPPNTAQVPIFALREGSTDFTVIDTTLGWTAAAT